MDDGGYSKELKRKIMFQETSDHGVYSEYPEELKKEGEIALLLSSLEYTKFDGKTASALEKLKSKVLGGGDCRRVIRLSRKHQVETTQNTPQLDELVQKLITDYNPPAIPPVPGLNRLIGRCSQSFEKQLTGSDVRDDQSRLSMNKEDVITCLLPLLKTNEVLSNGINVTTYDSEGKGFEMVFKRWNSKIHVLTGGWKVFFHEKQLERHQDFVTIWMFRNLDTGRLCFVITRRRLPVFEPIRRKKNKKLTN